MTESASTVGLEVANGQIDVTPGVVDKAALVAYTTGQCAALARALHEATGWGYIVALMMDAEGQFNTHAAVISDEDVVVDICGRQSLEVFEARMADVGRSVQMWRAPASAIGELIAEGALAEGDLEVARSFVDIVLDMQVDPDRMRAALGL